MKMRRKSVEWRRDLTLKDRKGFLMAWLSLQSRCRAFFAGIVLAFVSCTTAGVHAQDRQNYQLGTAKTSELSHAVGVTLAALIKLKLLPSANIDINARNTPGSGNNVGLLKDGEIDFAILTSLDARRASTEALSEGEAGNDLHMLTNLWQEAYHILIRKDLAPTGTLADLLQLEGVRIAIGGRESDGSANGTALLQALGLNNVPAIEAFRLEDAAQAFQRGELDAFVLASEGSSEIELLSFLDEAGEAAELLGVSDEDLDLANGRGPKVWSSIDTPFSNSSDQDAKKQSFAINYLLGATASVDDEAVYLITKTIFDNLPVLQGMHGATDGISLQNAFDGIILPVHSGAERYYGEIGVNLPEPELVRVSNLAEADFLTRFSTTEEARLRLAGDNVSILGGQDGQTIGRFTSELASTLEAGTLRVLGMTSPDPANNIAQVLYAKGIDNAFVPLDVLDYALKENIYPGLQSKLVYTTELFSQEFHLVTKGDINDIDDLIDQKVNLGTRNSGSEFTASFLFDDLDIPIEPTYFEANRALALLEEGKIAAMVVVAGKPAPIIEALDRADGLRLLPVPVLEGDAYKPATVTAEDYPSLLDAVETVETFGVRTALMTYNWRTSNPRYAALSAFVESFFNKLSSLNDQKDGLHPKWNDINPFAELDGWRRFSAAQDWLDSGQPFIQSDPDSEG